MILNAAIPQYFWYSRRAVGFWLLSVAGVILAMITVGGLTRITGSGLSITEWDPIMGVIPPLSDGAWQEAFAKYRHIPQYIRENRGMSLTAFKGIFWWEWAHRSLGRLLAVQFAVPFVWFAWIGAIQRSAWSRMLLLFALGGLQAFVGWWMVESGLETRVSVSQYRLAIHLGVALMLLVAILWTALEYLREPRNQARAAKFAKWSFAIAGLVYLQMLLGALVAGLHAGLIYNTWPTMDGRIIPEDAFVRSPWWLNFFENPGTAQFDHRIGAYVVAAAVLAIWWTERQKKVEGFVQLSANAMLLTTLFQIVLGIVTLMMQAPEFLAASHQLTAALLLCTAVWHAFELRYAASA
jgi:cytochrome c oxidase assembly protein subunit 15